MRAITMQRYGGPDVLSEQEADLPSYGDYQVLVELYATSVNPVDANIRAGLVQEVFPVDSFPHILGLDLAGIVKEVGDAVTRFKPGDRVFGIAISGTYAEYAVAEESQLASLPGDVSFEKAGASPAVALTAWDALFRFGELQAGERVLIHGGAGGVGHVAIQMAKRAGAYVITTASARNHDFVRSLGADEVIDYAAVNFASTVRDVDLVLDFIVGLDPADNCAVLRTGGRVVSIVTPSIADIAQQYGAVGKFVIVERSGEVLAQIGGWLQGNGLSIHAADILSLDETALRKAHAQIETKHTKGKIVIQIRQEA